MKEEIFESIVTQLAAINFSGEIGLHFFDEPLANPKIAQKVQKLHERVPKAFLYINSNGDYLTAELLEELVANGLGRLLVSQYDGKFSKNIERMIPNLSQKEKEVLKIKISPTLLNNRAGSLSNFTLPEPLISDCYLPSNQLVINFKGEVLICCSDYYARVVLGKVEEKPILRIWSGHNFKLIRKALKKKNRAQIATCKNCNFSGDFYTDKVFTEND
jgi:radical SAM protein with 4Fe4S-binding SPASM domain